MYQVLTYPLDVIKTNRIVGSALSKEAGEAIPKEFLTLHEVGAMRAGLFRGFAPYIISMPFWYQVHQHEGLNFPAIAMVSGSFMLNPFAVMVTKK